MEVLFSSGHFQCLTINSKGKQAIWSNKYLLTWCKPGTGTSRNSLRTWSFTRMFLYPVWDVSISVHSRVSIFKGAETKSRIFHAERHHKVFSIWFTCWSPMVLLKLKIGYCITRTTYYNFGLKTNDMRKKCIGVHKECTRTVTLRLFPECIVSIEAWRRVGMAGVFVMMWRP